MWILVSGGPRGGAQGGQAPSPPYLRVWMTAPPSPPLSQGPDSALLVLLIVKGFVAGETSQLK